MRLAIIDLGTNSVRFDIVEIHYAAREPHFRHLHREKMMVRLGEKVFLKGCLDVDAMRRCLHAFQDFARMNRQWKVDRVLAFGTSALREASDAERFLHQIRKTTGIDVRVLSGPEEARLIAKGILAKEALPPGRFALVDIGGGSTEISVCNGKRVLAAASFPLGTARLQQLYLRQQPAGPKAVLRLRKAIRKTLEHHIEAEAWPKVGWVLGSSGTIRMFAKMLKRQTGKRTFSTEKLSKLIRRMTKMTGLQLAKMPGIEAKRGDMILSGGILLEEAMRALRCKKARATDYSLRDGILFEELEMLRREHKSLLPFHMEEVFFKAAQLGGSEDHARKVSGLASELFERLANVHRLPSKWKPYLLAAAALHDVGEAISPSFHEEHSYYVVKHSDFPALEEWEKDLIAELCRAHIWTRLPAKKVPYGRSPEKRRAFLRLLPLLVLADALDHGHKKGAGVSSLHLGRLNVDRRAVRIQLVSNGPVDLEVLRVEQKKKVFDDAFGKKLVVKASGT